MALMKKMPIAQFLLNTAVITFIFSKSHNLNIYQTTAAIIVPLIILNYLYSKFVRIIERRG